MVNTYNNEDSEMLSKDGKVAYTVSIPVTLIVPVTDKDVTYGPIQIVLKRKIPPGSWNSGNIDTNTAFVYETTDSKKVVKGSDPKTIQLTAKFAGITSSWYKVCIVGTAEICKDGNRNHMPTIEPKSTYTKQFAHVEGESTTSTTTDPTTSCKIDGIGWLVCPIFRFASKIVDGAYSIVSKLLTTPSVNMNLDDDSNNTYKVWKGMRSIANVVFVIAFLIIIFSQITSVGISNYGVKRMLPKLVIAAILVNLSYYVCAIAVDLSNLLGVSIKQLFESIVQTDIPKYEATTGEILGGGSLLIGGAAVGVALTGTTLTGALAVLLPGLIAAVFAIFIVLIILTLRQALIILLIVISPLAFVAYLLPNTEEWFKKWRETFTTMLLMFPIISAIFGASALASRVIISSSSDWTVQLMGMFVSVIPLAISPIVMKSAGSLLGKVGGMLQNSALKKPFDSATRWAEGNRERQRNAANNRAMNSSGFRGSWRRNRLRHVARRDEIDQNQQREFNYAKSDYISRATRDNDVTFSQQALSIVSDGRRGGRGLRDRMIAGSAAGSDIRARSSATSKADELAGKDIKNIEELIKSDVPENQVITHAQDELRTALENGDTLTAIAAKNVLKSKGSTGLNSLLATVRDVERRGNYHGATMTTFKRSVSGDNLKSSHQVLAVWSHDNRNRSIDDTITGHRSDLFNNVSDMELASNSAEALAIAINYGSVSMQRAREILTNPTVAGQLKDRATFEAYANFGTLPPLPRGINPPPTP
jgi:hypothetical protein